MYNILKLIGNSDIKLNKRYNMIVTVHTVQSVLHGVFETVLSFTEKLNYYTGGIENYLCI